MQENPTPRKHRTAGMEHEKQCLAKGMSLVAGMDEAGRGPWAGPVVVGMVVLPLNDPEALAEQLKGVRDSKKTTTRQRTILAERIKAIAITWGIGQVSAREIDTLGMTQAVAEANLRALTDAQTRTPQLVPHAFLLDHFGWNAYPDIEKVRITRGDQHSISIAAASILAKTARDAYMQALDSTYPLYAFGQHKGYGTTDHRIALHLHGVTPEHRRSFKPIAKFLS